MRLLIISAIYAPDTSPRAYRWSAIAETWAARGHIVDVVAAWKPGDARDEVMTFGDPAIGVPEAIKAAGLPLPKIITTAGGKVNYAYIESEDQAADLGSSTDFLGWKAIDAASRAISGQSVEPDEGEMPTQFLTAETIDFDIEQPWPAVPGFREQFEALWGVQG